MPDAVQKTTITVTVLSHDPLPDDMTLAGIAAFIDEGDGIGGWDVTGRQRVDAADVAQELRAVGNDGSFFGDEYDETTVR